MASISISQGYERKWRGVVLSRVPGPLRPDAVRFRGFGQALPKARLICRHGGFPGFHFSDHERYPRGRPPASPLRLHAGRFERAGWNSRGWKALTAACAISLTSCRDREERTGIRFEKERVYGYSGGAKALSGRPLAPAIATIRASRR